MGVGTEKKTVVALVSTKARPARQSDTGGGATCTEAFGSCLPWRLKPTSSRRCRSHRLPLPGRLCCSSRCCVPRHKHLRCKNAFIL